MSMTPFADKADAVQVVAANMKEEAKHIKEATGISRFAIEGSHASHRLSDACVKLQDSQTDLAVVAILLLSNDIDVYYGDFMDDPTTQLLVNKFNIKSSASTNKIDEEDSRIECKNLNLESFLSNKDITTATSCINIVFLAGKLQALIHALSWFWKCLFQDNLDRIIKPPITVLSG